jgi:hypothetical protein
MNSLRAMYTFRVIVLLLCCLGIVLLEHAPRLTGLSVLERAEVCIAGTVLRGDEPFSWQRHLTTR